MNSEIITSLDNPMVKEARSLNDKKFRKFKFVSSLSVIMGILLVTGIVIFICFT